MKALLILSLLAALPIQAGEKAPRTATTAVEKTATVGGQVRRPGPIKHYRGVSLYAAIQAAGGATEFGAVNRVKILRNGKATLHDLRKDEQKLTELEPGDVIEVPQKNIFGR